MKYSQPARAASSRRDFSLSGATIRLFRFTRPKLRHPLKDAVGSSRKQDGFAVTRSIVAASGKSPDRHAGRLGRLHAANAVFDHERSVRVGLHPLGRIEKKIRR